MDKVKQCIYGKIEKMNISDKHFKHIGMILIVISIFNGIALLLKLATVFNFLLSDYMIEYISLFTQSFNHILFEVGFF